MDRPSVTDDVSSTFDNQGRPFPQFQVRFPCLQDGFSWLDLEAIGESVFGGGVSNDVDLTNMQRSTDISFSEGINWVDTQFLVGDEFSRIF